METRSEQRPRFLKWVLALGGAYEVLMGAVLLFFIRDFFRLLAVEAAIGNPIFARTSGVLAVAFGLLLLGASRDPARYLLVPLISIALRVLIQVPIILGIREIPALTYPLIGFGAVDLAWAALTFLALRAAGLNWRDA